MSDDVAVIDRERDIAATPPNAVLKTLTMTGFKSFVHRTRLEFAPGITAVLGPNGSGKCITASQRVTLSDGREVAIRELVDNALQSGSVDVMDDGYIARSNQPVEILSLNPRDLRIEPRPVSAFVKRRAPKTLLRITTRSGRSIETTRYHPLFTLQNGELSALRAEDVRRGVRVALPRQLPTGDGQAWLGATTLRDALTEADNIYVAPSEDFAEWATWGRGQFGGWSKWCRAAGVGSRGRGLSQGQALRTTVVSALAAALGVDEPRDVRVKSAIGASISLPQAITPELCRFLGFLVAEGNAPDGDQARFTNSDPAVLDEFERLAREVFDVRVGRSVRGNATAILLSNRAVVSVLQRSFGIRVRAHSAEKQVPSQVLSAPEYAQWAFLSGLFEGDAFVCANRRHKDSGYAYLEYATASRPMADQVVSLLLRLGVFSMLRAREKEATNSRRPTRRTYYSVYVYGARQLRYMAERLQFVGAKESALRALRGLEVAENPNLDLVPGATALVRDAAKLAGVSVKKHRKGRARLAAYTERRCEASRPGLLEVAAQIEQLGTSPEAAQPILDRLGTLARSDVYWDEVEDVEEFDSPDEWVYDLCVEGNHNFVAENVIVHNSNIADAIRWALGENNARVLRAKRNEELIFAGSETRKALGMAEAVLQLDNESRRLPIDFAEIEVGRRLFKNGEAEYLVNRARVRLRDLQDLLAGAHLADNPFVVIGQGLVDQILALRPADRRTVIEEAAGTRRLQRRREDALERLKKSETELVRVIDILREIGPRVALLTEQASKWTEYERTRNELRRKALSWYRGSFGETASVRADLIARIAGLDREIDRLAALVLEIESMSTGTDEELQRARQEEERRRIAAADAAQTLAGLRARVASLQASLEAVAAERDRSREALVALPAELASLRERRASIDQETTDAARGARDSAADARVAEEEASRTRLALAEAQAGRVEAERAAVLREADEVRLADLERALLVRDEEIAGTVSEIARERSTHERERERIARELGHAREAVDGAAHAAEAAAADAARARQELQRLDGELALVRGQWTALREAAERAERELGGREAAGSRPPLPAGLRWMEERVPDALRRALTAALGDGVALGEGPGDEGPVPARTRRLVPGLPVFLADDEEAALAAAASTRSGTIVAPSGLLVVPGLVRLPRADAAREGLVELRAMAARLRSELTNVERAREALAVERDDAEARVQDADDRLSRATAERVTRERAAELLASVDSDQRDAIRSGDVRLDAIERERVEILARRERLDAERAAAAAAREAATEAFRAAEGSEREAVDRYGEAAKRAEDARLQAATNEERRAQLARLRDELDERVGLTERRIADEEARTRALAAQERESRHRLEEAQAEQGAAVAAAKEAERSAELSRQRSLAAEGSRREAEQRLASSRERLAVVRGDRSKLALEEERASGALRLLEEQVRAELGLPDDEPLPDPESLEGDEGPMDERERASAMRDLQRLRRRLLSLEPVNPLAATELAEVGERHRFLASQREDLERAIKDLRSLADELATTIAEQFSATLQAVDREFGVFFQQLFAGGQASLRTSDAGAGALGSHDDEEPGIDIYARPPGKRVGSLNQLSGGERALTAMALLLAILRVKPAPFCVLDEVDAALDERNVGRFTQALRSLTDRTQFVVITHNRGTIEAADTLYGVSMDEGGVSKIISLRLSELDERAG